MVLYGCCRDAYAKYINGNSSEDGQFYGHILPIVRYAAHVDDDTSSK